MAHSSPTFTPFAPQLPRNRTTNAYTQPVSQPAKKIVIDDPGSRKPSSKPLPRWLAGASWLVPPIIFGSVIGAIALLRQAPGEVFTGFLAIVCGIPVLWGLASVFLPAHPDRRCPDCNKHTLEQLEEGQLTGLSCTSCGFVDRSASAWKFVEEGDAALEPLIMKDRKAATLPKVPQSDHGGSQ
ncbi:MAG: hypothetical protein ACI8X5_003801 [Planctomycetota bacterium]|jgi:hypothetical protein